MASKNEKAGCLDKPAGSPSTLKLRASSTRRSLTEARKQCNTPSSAGKQTSKRIEDDFTNPWRCDSAPYDPLPITHYKPVCNPPYYFDESLDHLSITEKVRNIMAYHYAQSKQMTIFARSQPLHVPLGDPVQECQLLFNGAVERKKSVSDALPEAESTYVSRSGRHVKRRPNFSYDVSDEDDPEKEQNTKKAKLSDEDFSMSTKSTPVAKRNTRKMTNAEIIARSSLFADSPSRTAAMFSKLDLIEKEKKKAELQQSNFEKTLTACSDDDDFDVQITSTHDESVAVVDEEEPFARRRIVPPVPARKGRSAMTKDKETEVPTTSTSSAPSRDDFAGSAAANSPAASKRTPKKKQITNCPICGGSFPLKQIEEHASTCGLTSELEIESSIPNRHADPARY